MKKRIFVAAAAIIFSTHVQAQHDTTSKTLDEVIITANKFPQKQSETGKVVTTITKEEIEKLCSPKSAEYKQIGFYFFNIF